MGKYLSSRDESELLPDLLKLTDKESIEQSEFEVFLLAELTLTDEIVFPKYVLAVQAVASREYLAMESIIKLLF